MVAPTHPSKSLAQMTCTIYWTVDIPVSMLTATYRNGKLVTSYYLILYSCLASMRGQSSYPAIQSGLDQLLRVFNSLTYGARYSRTWMPIDFLLVACLLHGEFLEGCFNISGARVMLGRCRNIRAIHPSFRLFLRLR